MKILIVDDDYIVRNVLRQVVEHYGHEAVEARDGKEGLEKASQHKPDAIISDALMPKMDGFQFLRAVRQDETLSKIPFVFYTAIYTGDKEYELALSLGAAALIVKPKTSVDFWKEFTSALDVHASKKKLPPQTLSIEREEDHLGDYCRIVATSLEEKVRELEETINLHRRTENDLRNMEKTLQSASDEWRNTFDAMGNAIALLDRNGKILRCNRAMAELVGKNYSEIVGRKCWKIVHGASGPVDCCPCEIMKKTRKRETLVTQQGDRWFEVTADPFFDSDGNLLGAVHIMVDITEQKRNQETLSQSEQRYRNLVESAQDVIFTLSSDGVVVSLNPVFETITGWSRVESIGQNFIKFVHPDDLSIAMDNFLRVMRGESPPLYVLRILHKSGDYLYGEFLAKPNLQDGNIVGLSGIARDITKRKRDEDITRNIALQQTAILNNIPDIAWLKDAESRFIVVNEPFGKVCGVRPEDLVGKTDLDIWPTDLAERYRADDREVMESGKQKRFEEPLADKAGKIAWIETIKTPIYNEKGEVIGITGIARDVTGRKQLEDALKAAVVLAENEKARSESIIAAIGDGITIQDRAFRILYQNQSAKNMGGEHVGELCYMAYEKREQRCDGCPVAMVFDDGEVHTVVRSAPTDNGIMFFEITASPLRDSKGNIIAGIEVVHNITERKHAEEALKESENKFRSLTEQALVGTYIFQDNVFKYVNPRFIEIFGYSAEELIGRLGPMNLTLPEDQALVEKNIRKRQSGEVESVHYEFRGVRKGGQIIHIELLGSNIMYQGRRAVIGTLLDITKRKLADEQLSQITREWEETFNSITDMVTVHDKDFNIIRANKAAEKILGIPFLKVKKVKCFEYYHGTGCPPDGCPSCQSLVTGKPSTSEMFEPHLNMFIEIQAIPRFDSNNQIAGLIHVVRDISERKKAEDILKEEKNKAQNYLDVAGVMIVALDSGGRITLINKKGLEIMGYEEHEIIGRSWFDQCIPVPEKEEVQGIFNTLMTGNTEPVENFENCIVTKNGEERLLAFHNAILRSESGEIYGVLSSGEDITEQKLNRDELHERVHQAVLGAEIGVALTRGSDLRTTLQLCAEAMVLYLDAAFARIWTLNEREKVLEMQASAGMYTHINGAHGRVPVGKFKIGLIAEERQPHLTNQVIGDPRVGDQEWAIKEGMVAFAGYPLIVQDRLVGVMAMFSRRQIAEATMSSLASVADVIALGIERKRTEETLASYSLELTSLNMASDTLMLITNLRDIYEEICNIIYTVFDLKMVWLGVIGEGSFEVKPVAHAGFEDGYLSTIRVTWDDSPTGMGPIGMSIKSKTVIKENINDLLFAPWQSEAQKRGYEIVLSVPIMYARDKCLGALTFYSDNPDYFTSDRIKLYQIFANQAAIAIENARLVSGLEVEVRKRTKALEDTNMELQQLNKELYLRREEADAASRSKTDFLANMSHELRTPLNAIMGFSDIMQQGMAGPVTDKQKEFLNDISESGNHLLTLITDILDLSKVEAGKLELEPGTVSLKEIIESSLSMFKEKALKHNIKATTEIDNTITSIIADQRKLKQVVVNLLSNAFKFTPDGGAVRVAARRVVRDLGLGVSEKGPIPNPQQPTPDRDFVEISVSDTGIGISKENQQRLFQPFQQIETSLTRKYAGTGLGLSLCRRLVELHGGRMWVESESGKGSRFVFIIPMKQ